MKNINSNFKFSLFNKLFDTSPEQDIDINQLIEYVKYPYLKSELDRLRSLDKADYKKEKLKLPAVTLSGVFTERKNTCLVSHSGLMQIDFDDISTYRETRNALVEDPYTYVLFRSPSGDGIKMIVKVNPSKETHKSQFLALEKHYLDEYDLEMDKGTKDVSRAMLLSYDPNLYCNPFSETFEEFLEEKIYTLNKIELNRFNESRVEHLTQNSFEGRDEYLVKKLCEEVRKRNIDITDSFQNWISIGFILSNTFGESGRSFFHQLSVQHSEYNYDKCDVKYTQLNRDNNGGLNFGTLIYIARNQGVELFDDGIKTKHTVNSKKGLREALKKKRLEISIKNGKPAYTVFSNKTLESLLIELPKSNDDFGLVYGFGKKKVQHFGLQILKLINSYIV